LIKHVARLRISGKVDVLIQKPIVALDVILQYISI